MNIKQKLLNNYLGNETWNIYITYKAMFFFKLYTIYYTQYKYFTKFKI